MSVTITNLSIIGLAAACTLLSYHCTLLSRRIDRLERRDRDRP